MICFEHPSTILISGPTGSGKTQFVVNLIKNKLFEPFPERIVWVYGEWQQAYDLLLRTHSQIEFVNGLPKELYDFFSKDKKNLLILDDQMSAAGANKDVANIFTRGSHHKNLTVIYIVQNLFDKGREMRTISLNSQYLVVFKAPRDSSQIRLLGQQIYPKRSAFLVDAYNDATSTQFGYLLIDLHPRTPDKLRFRTNIFNLEGPTIYIPKVL